MNTTLLTVVSKTLIHGLIQRVVFKGDGLGNMPSNIAGLHIKLFFLKPGQVELCLPTRTENGFKWPEEGKIPFMRNYSVRYFDRNNNHLTVDFVLHNSGGPASDFARYANIGDVIGFDGPGPAKLINEKCSNVILFGDLSALPAIAAISESINRKKIRGIFLDLPNHDAIRPLVAEYFDSFDTILVLNQKLNGELEYLNVVNEFITNFSMTDTSVFLAGEHASVVYIRRFLRAKQWPKENLYAVPYWRHATAEDNYRQERHAVIDS